MGVLCVIQIILECILNVFQYTECQGAKLRTLFNEVLITESYFKSDTESIFQNDETGCIMKTIWWQHFCRK